jgi:hypothetical protein
LPRDWYKDWERNCCWKPYCKVHGLGIEMCLIFSERWLTPGTEYAIPEKLPLPRDWYNNWDAIAAATNGAATGLTEADIDDGIYPAAFWLFWVIMPGDLLLSGKLQAC